MNEIVTGLVGVVFIGAAFLSSLRYRKLHPSTEDEDITLEVDDVKVSPKVGA